MASKRFLVSAGLWALGAGNAAAFPMKILPIIYGMDDRLDVFEVKDAAVRKLAESTVALFTADRVDIDEKKGVASLATKKYGEKEKLASSERFYDQSAGAFCSGALVGSDLVLTAGHCIPSKSDCESTKFVFGFAVTAKGGDPSAVPSGNVFGCKEVVRTVPAEALPRSFAELMGQYASRSVKADWALVRLDREAKGRASLAIEDAAVAKDQKIFVIGYPSGLPAKVAAGATVTDDSKGESFKADLDTYAGNSGSPVFDAATNRIVGVLVRGNKDFVEAGILTSAVGVQAPAVSVVTAIAEAPSLTLQSLAGLTKNISNVQPQGTVDAEGVTRASAFKETVDKALADPHYVVAGTPKESGGSAAAVVAAFAGELQRLAPPPAKPTK